MLSHGASVERILTMEAILADKKTIDYNKVASYIYSLSKVGVAGFTEHEVMEAAHGAVDQPNHIIKR